MALYTKLDVVNRGLRLLGQLPVNDIETPHPAVPGILLDLDTTNKAVQSRKWWFNYELTTLVPQAGNSRILVPNDVASIDAFDKRLKVAQRGRYLYDTENGVYEFASSVKVYLHRVVPFEELPAAAAHYVTTQTLKRLQSSLDGDGPRYRDLAEEDAQAYGVLTAEDTRNTQANLLHRRGVQTALYRINQYSTDPFRR